MWTADDNRNANVADVEMAEAVLQDHFADRPALTGVCFDLGHLLFCHRGIGFVIKSDGDALKNLYNDPDVNAKDEKFRLEATPPGKTDWTFDLQVAGKDSNTKPGEHAVMADRGKKKG